MRTAITDPANAGVGRCLLAEVAAHGQGPADAELADVPGAWGQHFGTCEVNTLGNCKR